MSVWRCSVVEAIIFFGGLPSGFILCLGKRITFQERMKGSWLLYTACVEMIHILLNFSNCLRGSFFETDV